MRKVILYIAMSIDGYICDEHGGVDWLVGHDKDNQDSTYDTFIQNIDTICMGYTTYHQIIHELSPDVWPYFEQHTYVLTHHQNENTKNISFVDDIHSLLLDLKSKDGKDIWICGGASLVKQCIDDIDEFHISIIPTILSRGTSLFQFDKQISLYLMETSENNGIVELKYKRK